MKSKKKILNNIEHKTLFRAGTALALVVGFTIVGFGNAGLITNLHGGGTVYTDAFWSADVWNLSNTAEESDLIVTGEVIHVSDAKWNNSKGLRPENITPEDVKSIYHNVVIDVNETIKGPDKNRVTIQVNTGKIGRYKRQKSSAPDYEEGEKVLVYIQKWQGHYQTFNQKYGKFNIEQKTITRNAPEKYQQEIDITALIDRQREKYATHVN